MEAWFNLMDLNPLYAGCLTYISMTCVYICLKTVLWWAVFGTVGLFKKWYTVEKWLSRTKWGILCVAALVVANFSLWVTFNPENDYLNCFYLVLWLLALRVTWREFFTLGGLLRGDWSFSYPELRFFAWNTFNPLIIFRIFRSPFSSSASSDDDWKEAVRREEYGYYQQRGVYI